MADSGESPKSQRNNGGPAKKTGRPRGGVRDLLRTLIGENGERAYDVIWEIAQGTRESKKWVSGGGDVGPVEVTQTPSIKEQLDAAALLIERLQGKTPQPITDSNGDALSIVINTGGGK